MLQQHQLNYINKKLNKYSQNNNNSKNNSHVQHLLQSDITQMTAIESASTIIVITIKVALYHSSSQHHTLCCHHCIKQIKWMKCRKVKQRRSSSSSCSKNLHHKNRITQNSSSSSSSSRACTHHLGWVHSTRSHRVNLLCVRQRRRAGKIRIVIQKSLAQYLP